MSILLDDGTLSIQHRPAEVCFYSRRSAGNRHLSGKSLVADLLLWRAVSEEGAYAIMILPFVALVREKEASLRKIGDSLGK